MALTLELKQNSPSQIKQKTPILFLHGAWHGAWCWEKYFLPYFERQGFLCYAMSLRGHGASPPPDNINQHRLKDYAGDLKTVVDHIETPPIIVAHSMGGIVLQKYLEKYTCKAAVLMATVPPAGVLRITTKLIFTRKYAIGSILRRKLYGIVNSPSKTRWAFFSDDVPETEIQAYADQMKGESFRAFLDMLYPNVKIGQHKEIPMLVLGADRDQIFTVKEQQKTAQKYGADIHIFENIAHDMMLDTHHIQVADYLREWIQKIN